MVRRSSQIPTITDEAVAEALKSLRQNRIMRGNPLIHLAWIRDYAERQHAVPGPAEQARVHLRLGMAYHESGDGDRAISHLQAALSLMRQVGDALGESRALNNLGTAFAVQERVREALAVWQEALHLQEALGDAVGMAYTWFNLGDLYWQLGQHEQAQVAMSESRGLADHMALTALQQLLAGHPATT